MYPHPTHVKVQAAVSSVVVAQYFRLKTERSFFQAFCRPDRLQKRKRVYFLKRLGQWKERMPERAGLR